jgi:hypothetical protein
MDDSNEAGDKVDGFLGVIDGDGDLDDNANSSIAVLLPFSTNILLQINILSEFSLSFLFLCLMRMRIINEFFTFQTDRQWSLRERTSPVL